MGSASGVAVAAVFVWLGMVLAISFIEAPLKFRAPGVGTVVAAAVAVIALLVQVLLVRPQLTKRSDAVLAGDDGPRSRAHYVYVGFELVKVIGLLVAGICLLA